MLTVITPTGSRPAAFALCERMMARQVYDKPVRWIIVDDGPVSTPLTETTPGPNWSQWILRPEPFWRPGDNTQARNLIEALDAAERLKGLGEELRVVVIEDDDWYDPRWLATIDAALDRAELAGESHARYYNVRMRRGADLNNAHHASLRCSGMRGRGLAALRLALGEFSKAYDFKMWRDPSPSKFLFQTHLTVGMKGLPGRPGIAAGHEDLAGRADRDLKLLRAWIGDDADLYADFFKEDAMSGKIQVYATGRLKRYGNRALVAGDVFDVTPQEARAFEFLKFATLSPPSEVAQAAGQRPPPPPAGEAPRTRKGKTKPPVQADEVSLSAPVEEEVPAAPVEDLNAADITPE